MISEGPRLCDLPPVPEPEVGSIWRASNEWFAPRWRYYGDGAWIRVMPLIYRRGIVWESRHEQPLSRTTLACLALSFSAMLLAILLVLGAFILG